MTRYASSLVSSQIAYEHCRRIARASGSSFYTGMRLLPPDRRAALFAVYALARQIDDIADGDLPNGEKLAALAQTRDELTRIGESVDPVLVAVADAASRFPIPLEAFGDLVDGAELDTRGAEYESFADLERYCRYVAGSIGRLALGVFDCSDRVRGSVLADDLGVALQIGNVLRDVTEDVTNGRIYLPREDLERFGVQAVDGRLVGREEPSSGQRFRSVTQTDVRAKKQTATPAKPAWPPAGIASDASATRPEVGADKRRLGVELLIAFEAQRGLEWLDRGLNLIPLLDRRSASAVLAMAGKYRVLLERIAQEPSLVLNGRLSLRRWEKGLVLARSLAGVGA